MLRLQVATDEQFKYCQAQVTAHHYLHAPVDRRARPMAYVICHEQLAGILGCLMFTRPEATRSFQGGLTYGSLADVKAGRAAYDRWEVLNLARVWVHPSLQRGGQYYTPDLLPGYYDRKGTWRSTVASSIIQTALGSIGFDYLLQFPPCFLNEPYVIRVILSYCDSRIHHGTIYRAAQFGLSRVNASGIETWYTPQVAPLTDEQDRLICRQSDQSVKVQSIRAARQTRQLTLEGV